MSLEQLREWELSFELTTDYDLRQVLNAGRKVLESKRQARVGGP